MLKIGTHVGGRIHFLVSGHWSASPKNRFLVWRGRFAFHLNQRIWIINRSPRLTFCRPKLLQILSPCVLPPPPHPLLLLTSPRPPSVSPPPIHTRKEDLEQFRTTESWAWASVINSYSLILIFFEISLNCKDSSTKLFTKLKVTAQGLYLINNASYPFQFTVK
jgi:hypothetical protein